MTPSPFPSLLSRVLRVSLWTLGIVAVCLSCQLALSHDLSALQMTLSEENPTRDCTVDTDDDGLTDCREDFDGDGLWNVDLHETDPENPDSDGDGLTDGEEKLKIGRIERLAEEEEFYLKDPQRLDPNNPDSDGDCIPDGVELGLSRDEAQELIQSLPTRPSYHFSQRCLAVIKESGVSELEHALPRDETKTAALGNIAILFDLDPASHTDPTLDDTDDDGLGDGLEDVNFNGRRDGDGDGDVAEADGTDANGVSTGEAGAASWKETDPALPDSDGDGLLDGDEGDRDGDGTLGADESDPLLPDTDHDGVNDGDERRVGTKTNTCDTDGDGLSDGVEMARIQPDAQAGCHGLQAEGSNYRKPTILNPLNPDSDADGLADGAEDANANGWVDEDETDPSIVDTDADGIEDGVETDGDADGDGLPDFDYRLIQGEGNCRPPESIADVDCDGVPNARDDDSDGDGCADALEGGFRDSNVNGIPDIYDNEAKLCPDPSTGSSSGTGQGGGTGSGEEKQLPSGIFPRDGFDGAACTLVGEGGPRRHAPIVPLILTSMLLVLATWRSRYRTR